MKALVTKAYTDRITGEIHLAGENVELGQARAEELSAGGFVEVVKSEKADATAKSTKSAKSAQKPRAKSAACKG